MVMILAKSPLKIYFVLGEESGDALGADLYPALIAKGKKNKIPLEIIGLGGTGLDALGVKSLFNIEEISVMGISAVVARLPTIIKRVKQTVADILEQKPDVIVLIDSPDFTHAVAKRVRKKMPNVPIINYVCPSVWAWRSGRARKMRAYIDHVLAILPFEPQKLIELDGPKATYIGHPLARKIAALPKTLKGGHPDNKTLLLLPGSRQSEVKRMLQLYGETITILHDRGAEFDLIIPAVPHLKKAIILETTDWKVKPTIVDSANNDKTFANARAALATSGTVTLQLALHKVPMVTGYRFDAMAKPFLRFVTTWSALLPNLIADKPIVPEYVNESVVPGCLARHLELLLADSPERKLQLAGFTKVIKAMKTKRPPSELAAEVILSYVKND